MLAEVCSDIYMPESGVRVSSGQSAVERAGLTALGFSLGIRRLVKRGFITISIDADFNGQFQAIYLTEDAWVWIEANEDMFKVHKRKAAPREISDIVTDDDVPFDDPAASQAGDTAYRNLQAGALPLFRPLLRHPAGHGVQ